MPPVGVGVNAARAPFPRRLTRAVPRAVCRIPKERSRTITLPIFVFVAFAGWTLAILILGVGMSRWSLILRGRAALTEFPADVPHGSPRYRRIMRAHANCVENLPVYGAVALAIVASGAEAPWLDTLSVVFLAARVAQSLVHVVPRETNLTVGLRFAFFCVQLACLISMGVGVLRMHLDAPPGARARALHEDPPSVTERVAQCQ